MDSELERLRASLLGRVEDCWERLEDAVSELFIVHQMHEGEIVDRVRSIAAKELDAAAAHSN